MVDAVKGANPASDIWIYEYGGTRFEKGHSACAVSKRVGRIWKGLFPQLDGAFWGMESDASEKMLSGPRNPRFGGDAASFESSQLIVQVIDDDIEQLRWKGARHRGLHPRFRRALPRQWSCLASLQAPKSQTKHSEENPCCMRAHHSQGNDFGERYASDVPRP